MTNIEKLYQEWRALQPIKAELQKRMGQQFMLDFNYNSLYKRDLQKFKEKGIIERIGGDRGGYWKINN